MLIFEKTILAPLAILLFGIYLRLRGVVSGTFGFTHDQGRDLLAAWSISHGDPTLIGPTTGLAGVFHGPLWYWLLAIFSFLGDGNPKFILGAVVFLYGAVEFWLFWVIKKFYGMVPAFLVLVIISFSPFFIATGGQLWSPNMVTLSTMVAAIALVGIANGKGWFWLLGLALGANIQFEAAGGVFLLISLVLALTLVKPPNVRVRDWIIFAASLFVTFIPQILFEAKNGFLMSKHVLSYLGERREDFIADYGIKTVEYKTGLFFDNFNKLFFGENVVLNLLFIFLMSVLFIKIFISGAGKVEVAARKKLILIWSAIVIFLMWVTVNLYTDVVWHHFLEGISIFFIIIIALMLFIFSRYLTKITFILIFLIFLGFLIPVANDLKAGVDFVGNHSVYRNQLKIIDEIYNDAGGASFNVVVYEPTTYAYTYQYLLSWYGKKRHGEEPVSNDYPQRLVYYIIEPDDIEGRRDKWIRERDGEGEIIWEKEFFREEKKNLGLVLQKRIRRNI
ncbi:MAG: hypothetical protein AAB639_03705 [Patescibacteria group bacterium]